MESTSEEFPPKNQGVHPASIETTSGCKSASRVQRKSNESQEPKTSLIPQKAFFFARVVEPGVPGLRFVPNPRVAPAISGANPPFPGQWQASTVRGLSRSARVVQTTSFNPSSYINSGDESTGPPCFESHDSPGQVQRNRKFQPRLRVCFRVYVARKISSKRRTNATLDARPSFDQ
ncbi:hypothetical protein B0H17DRAFT_1132307 [Mycena rosella]|uniref:Uncharacterized protein n=1 Tax=Mycena rosella TaxID=1033263 RepID=A0AAD7GKZ5_MYCRO|nr:hypothetical protein B0H17DRAFT_1132307 [Mycena rosella]